MPTAPNDLTVPPPGPAAFPLPLAITAILLTGAALILAGANVNWVSADDATSHAWTYANIALALCFLVAWPACTLPARPRRPTRTAVMTELATILIAAIPAFAVAAALAPPAAPALVQSLALQATLALLSSGILTWRARRAGPLLAALLIAAALLLPIAADIAAEFYPAAPNAWYAFVPLLAAAHAANGQAPDAFRLMIPLLAATGAALLTAGPGKPH